MTKLSSIEVKRQMWLILLCFGMLTWGGSHITISATEGALAEFSTTEVDFGRVPINDTYSKSVTVTNVGNAELVINYLSFSDVNVFSTTTKMPLTVEPGASKELNITYKPVSRGEIQRTLTVVSNSNSDQNKIKLKAQPYSINELHIQPVSGFLGEEVTISMTMNNMDAVSGYQVEFVMPEQLEFVEGSFALSDRKQDHSSAVLLNDNVLRIIVFSQSDKPLTGNDGEIGSFKVQSDKPLTGNDGEIGSFKVKLVGKDNVELKPSKTVLSATLNKVIENVVSDVYGGEVTINILGDANGDKTVDETDIKFVANYIMGNSPTTFQFISADVNRDNRINATDIVGIVSLIAEMCK